VPPFVLDVLKFALLALLYFFIWRAVRTVVADLYGPRQPRPARAPKVRGKPARAGKAPTRVLVLDERGRKIGSHRLNGTLQIGRAPNCQIRLDDNYISQLHAKISERNGSWVVEDLGSTNGTYLNQRKVTVPTEISAGDRIRVGKTVLEIRR
jgi:pSer/pThr/pTyr-binding forkhead associated (FHA) protein